MQQPEKLLILTSILVLLAACEEETAAGGRGSFGGPAEVVTQQVELQHIVDEIDALGTANANESNQKRAPDGIIIDDSIAATQTTTSCAR